MPLKLTGNLSKNLRIMLVVALVCILFWLMVWYTTNFLKSQILGDLPKASATVGQIIQTERKVLRNFSGQLIWQSAEPGDQIYVGNSIQTLEESNTVLQLSDGQKVNLTANSLIRIQKTEDGISLELIDGEIQVETVAEIRDSLLFPESTQKKEITIKTRNGILKTKNSSLKISQKKDSKTQPNVEVYKPTLKSNTAKAKMDSLVEVTEVGKLSTPEQHSPTYSPSTKVVAEIEAVGSIAPEIRAMPEINPKPQPTLAPVRSPAAQRAQTISAKKGKNLPLPEKKFLQAPKIKRLDVKVTE